MLIITSTRIVGLIAGVCAAVVAPQALAATSTHNTVPQPGDPTHNTVSLPGDPTHNTVSPPGDPSDVIQRYQLRGELSDQGLAPTAFAAVPSQSPMGQPANNTPGGFDLGDLKDRRAAFTAVTHKSLTAGSTAAAIKALQRRSVDLNAAYQKLYPGAYRHGSKQTNPGWGAAATAAKSVTVATLFYTPTNPGWGAAATAAKESAATLAVNTAPLGWFCFDQAKYGDVYERCQG